VQFPDFDPYLPFLHWGDFGVRWYALAYVAGILLGWRYAIRLIRDSKLWGGHPPTISETQVDDLVLWLTLGIIVGGRIGYVLFYMLFDPGQRADLFEHPLVILQIWHGGMSFHGGLLGVALAMVLFARANRIGLFKLADMVAPVVPIGLFFGRIANFINGELWGRGTDVPWGVIFCNDTIRAANSNGCPAGISPRHPSQIYEALLEGVVLFIVLRIATHRLGWLRRNGAITGLFLLGYALARIALENVRNPDVNMPEFPLGLTMGMMLSIPMLLGGAWLLWQALKTSSQPVIEAPEA
jgi:phosphatidylglycerol:prolipoprotein diacylglycerol transferase